MKPRQPVTSLGLVVGIFPCHARSTHTITMKRVIITLQCCWKIALFFVPFLGNTKMGKDWIKYVLNTPGRSVGKLCAIVMTKTDMLKCVDVWKHWVYIPSRGQSSRVTRVTCDGSFVAHLKERKTDRQTERKKERKKERKERHSQKRERERVDGV